MNTKASSRIEAKQSSLIDQPGLASRSTLIPTMIDVAAQAGVSTATVSRVLNGTGVVSPKMRTRVMAAIDELGFQLNPMAQGLRKGQGNTVALLVSDIEQTHFSAMTKHIQGALEGIGLDLLLFNVGHSTDRLQGFLRRSVSMRLKGVVIALSDRLTKSLGELLKELSEHGIIVVSIGQNLNRYQIPSVVHEEHNAAKKSVCYLLDQGRKRIAYVGRIKGSAIGTERFEGYRQALIDADVFDDALVWDVAYRYSAGRDAIERALERGLSFDGVQAGSDEMAMGAIAALHDRRIRVPDEVAIVGFGGIEMGAYVRPSLTTISSHPEKIGVYLTKAFSDDSVGPASLSLVPRNLIRRGSA